ETSAGAERQRTTVESHRATFGHAACPSFATFTAMLAELIPLALVVALSPLSIIPGVLVLHSPRPRPTGLAFLAGWIVGLAALTALFLEGSKLLGGRRQPRGWGARS